MTEVEAVAQYRDALLEFHQAGKASTAAHRAVNDAAAVSRTADAAVEVAREKFNGARAVLNNTILGEPLW